MSMPGARGPVSTALRNSSSWAGYRATQCAALTLSYQRMIMVRAPRRMELLHCAKLGRRDC